MKKTYIICIILIVIFAGSLSFLTLSKDLPANYLLIGFVLMNALTLLTLLCGKLFCSSEDKTSSVHNPVTSQNEESEPKQEVQVVNQAPEDIVSSEWSAGMYARFAEHWNDLFNNIQFPLQTGKKAEINVLCWEIASLTMDFLLVHNKDANVLERNKHSVDSVIKGIKVKDLDLKEFFEDPTTVPAKVLAVYNSLCPDLTPDQKFTTQIFGYLVDLEKKDEH